MQQSEGGTFGIGAVAKRTGLTPDVLRVWERRYGAVDPGRSAGGTRFYSEREVQRLEMLAGLVARGHRIGRLARLADAALRALVRETDAQGDPVTLAAVARAPEADEHDWLEEALEAVAAVDSATLEHQLSKLFLTLGPRRFAIEIAMPLLARVGESWEAGRISVAGEHACTSVMRSMLGGALRRRPGRMRTERALFATPADQRHEFGALAAALLASEHGLDAIHLGADLPVEEIVLAAERTDAGAVVLGLPPCETGRDDGDVAIRVVTILRTLRESLPEDVVLAAGGAFDRSRLRAVGVTAFASLADFDAALVRFGRVPTPLRLEAPGAAGSSVGT